MYIIPFLRHDLTTSLLRARQSHNNNSVQPPVGASDTIGPSQKESPDPLLKLR